MLSKLLMSTILSDVLISIHLIMPFYFVVLASALLHRVLHGRPELRTFRLIFSRHVSS